MYTLSVHRILLISFTLLTLAACDKPSHNTFVIAGPPDRLKGEDTLGFGVVSAILGNNRCSKCHDSFKNYPAVKGEITEIVSQIESGAMPDDRGPRVPANELEILKAWMAAGSPETSNLPLPGVGQQPGDEEKPGDEEIPVEEEQPIEEEQPKLINFERLRAEIFQPHCVQCHKGFIDYAKVVKRLDEIQAEVNSNRMPKDAAPLSDELKALLAAWIQMGAPE